MAEIMEHISCIREETENPRRGADRRDQRGVCSLLFPSEGQRPGDAAGSLCLGRGSGAEDRGHTGAQ